MPPHHTFGEADMRPFLRISLATSLVLLACCTAKNENLGATPPAAPDEAIEDGGSEADTDSDSAPEPLPPHCIGDWPTPPNAQPVPSIPDITPAVLWTKTVPEAFPGYVNHQLVWTGTHLGFTGGNKLWILDAEGEVSSILNLGAVMDVNDPLADEEGTFYFGSESLYAVRPDGSLKWQKALGPNVSPSHEMTLTSPLTLSADGILYFAATDGHIYAVRSEDGATLWKRPYTGNLPDIVMGVGDMIFFDQFPHLRNTGEKVGGLGLRYETVLYSRKRFVNRVFKDPAERYEFMMFDACGKLLWTHAGPTLTFWPSHLELFDDQLLIQEYRDDIAQAHIYSVDGEHRAGPVPVPDYVKVLGADGIIYAGRCTSDEGSTTTVAAYSLTLERLWSLDFGTPCIAQEMALADDGRLYVFSLPRSSKEDVTITAIQTASPGVANTSLATDRINNRRTRWLSP